MTSSLSRSQMRQSAELKSKDSSQTRAEQSENFGDSVHDSEINTIIETLASEQKVLDES